MKTVFKAFDTLTPGDEKHRRLNQNSFSLSIQTCVRFYYRIQSKIGRYLLRKDKAQKEEWGGRSSR